ncbi:MAG TPA: hypothetical protein VF807_15050 [Ktedonobacterales bacterium]
MSHLVVIASEGPLTFGLRRALSYASFWSPDTGRDPMDSLIGIQHPSVVVLDLVTPPKPVLTMLDALITESKGKPILRRHTYLAIKPGLGLPGTLEERLKTGYDFEMVAAHEPFGSIVNHIHRLEMRLLEKPPASFMDS